MVRLPPASDYPNRFATLCEGAKAAYGRNGAINPNFTSFFTNRLQILIAFSEMFVYNTIRIRVWPSW